MGRSGDALKELITPTGPSEYQDCASNNRVEVDVGPILSHFDVIAVKGMREGLMELEPMAIILEDFHVFQGCIAYDDDAGIL